MGCATCSETPGTAIRLYRTRPIEGVRWSLGDVHYPIRTGRLGRHWSVSYVPKGLWQFVHPPFADTDDRDDPTITASDSQRRIGYRAVTGDLNGVD